MHADYLYSKCRQVCLQAITRKLVSLTICSIVVLVIAFYVVDQSKSERTYLVAYVFLAGLIGGFVSIQQRLPSIGLAELEELSKSWLSVLLIPIYGGIFAIVLMLMFLSETLAGAAFPTFIHARIDRESLVPSFAAWLSTTFPASGQDVAKLLFWSFLSGFSERLVPQIIRKTGYRIDERGLMGEWARGIPDSSERSAVSQRGGRG